MISKWESQQGRLLRFVGIAPKKKLEWLREMQTFLSKALTKKQRYIYHKLRDEK